MSAELAVLAKIERLLSDIIAGGDEMVPVESVMLVRRIVQTQAEMLALGIHHAQGDDA